MAITEKFVRRDDLCGGVFKFKDMPIEEVQLAALRLVQMSETLTIVQLCGCGENMIGIEFRRVVVPGSKNFRTLIHAFGHRLRGYYPEKLVGWDVFSAPLYLPA